MKEVQDHFFKLAKEQGYRARSAFKLIEIDDRKRLLKKGDRVLDMGAAPGSWTQIAAARVGPKGAVVAVDLKPIDPRGLPHHVSLMQADLLTLTPDHFGGVPFDVVISDIGPDTSGDPFSDSVRSVQLCHALLDRYPMWLRRGGHTTMKVYEGGDYPGLLRRCAELFGESKGFKPKSSRAESVEMFVTCKGYRGPAARGVHEATRTRSRGWGGDQGPNSSSP